MEKIIEKIKSYGFVVCDMTNRAKVRKQLESMSKDDKIATVSKDDEHNYYVARLNVKRNKHIARMWCEVYIPVSADDTTINSAVADLVYAASLKTEYTRRAAIRDLHRKYIS